MLPLDNILDKKYSCVCCSECCTAWNLPIEQPNMDFLKQQNIIKSLLENENKDFISKDGKYYLPQKDYKCLFLNKNNNLCTIHEHFGVNNKPLECNKYPLTLLKDHNHNLYIETSFYCPSVLENIGESILSYNDSEFIQSCQRQLIPEKVLLAPEVQIKFEEAEDIKLKIVESLYNNLATIPVSDWWNVLLRHSRIFNQLENRISLNFEYDLNELFKKTSSLTTQDKGLLRQNILNAYIIIKQKNIPDTLSIFFRKGTLFDLILDSNINISKMHFITIDNSESIKNVLMRFLLDVFIRKTLLASNYSITGIYLLTISSYSLVLWYAKLNAILRKSSIADYEDIKKAIRLTERFYTAHNATFLPLYKDEISYIVLKNLCVI